MERDRNAFEIVFRSYYSELCSFALRYVQNKDEAEGLVQDLFCYLWENLDRLVIKTSLKSYLYQAVRNRAFNRFKHEHVKSDHQSHLERTSTPALDSSKVLEAKELQGIIDQSINALPQKCREVFELSRYQGLKYKEIAEQLGISIKTVENQMGKALKHLRSELSDYLPLAIIVWMELNHIGVFTDLLV